MSGEIKDRWEDLRKERKKKQEISYVDGFDETTKLQRNQ